MKTKTTGKLYMHTIDGKPADYYEGSGQICFLSNRRAANLYLFSTIKKHQRISIKNRQSWGFAVDDIRYGYVRVKP